MKLPCNYFLHAHFGGLFYIRGLYDVERQASGRIISRGAV
ncbi:Uncharacterised protein [Edwardsiella hoshinae]|uniref:Uncharacterized protein n=1 Tax=Edwardsiella hoshinae TaxID=93378 RepID=A0A376DGG1_9GAMM|nr:Uncharacterised protein [Edwardsiella hoshinae]